jgi:hypothetical protein
MALQIVWIVSLEWNFPPSEVTGDTGVVSVHQTKDGAIAARKAEQQRLHEEGQKVYNFPNAVDNEDDWDIDVHCTQHLVEP